MCNDVSKIKETAEHRRERFLNIIDARNYKNRKKHQSNTYNVSFLSTALATILARYVEEEQAEKLIQMYFVEEGW